MDMLRISIAGIIGILLAVQLKGVRPEYSIYISFGTSVILFFYVISKLEVVIETINQIQNYIHLNAAYVNALVKIIGITYIAEFSSAICRDAGYQAIASQIEVFSKISVLVVSTPILLALLETINGLIG